MREKEGFSISFAKVIRIIATVLAVAFIVVVIFFVFRTRVKADQAFRDAKNIYLALSTAEIEFYSQGLSVYDPANYSGLSEGVEERVKELVDNEGTYRIVSYDMKNHRVTGMIYNNGNYYVTFSRENDEIEWEVKYLMPIYTYKD